VETVECSVCGKQWHGRWYYSQDCVDSRIEGGVPTFSPIEYVGWLDPISRHRDGPAKHKEFQCFLFLRQDPVGAAVGGCKAWCVLS
jgi:hypothetical protein